MKKAICDVCQEEEVFTGESPLVVREMCKKCLNPKSLLTETIVDKPVTITSLTLAPSPSINFTRNNLKGSGPKEGLVISNVDNVLHNYLTGKTMVVEYKSRTKKPYIDNYGQWSIYKVINDGLLTNSNYLGTFVIWSNEYELEDSDTFKINGVKVSKQDLIKFMNLEDEHHIAIDFNDYNLYKKIMGKRS